MKWYRVSMLYRTGSIQVPFEWSVFAESETNAIDTVKKAYCISGIKIYEWQAVREKRTRAAHA